MVRIKDDSRTVEITMKVWHGNGYSEDYAHEFFEIRSLPYDEETDTYSVQDVDYCIEQAVEWARIGNLSQDSPDYDTGDSDATDPCDWEKEYVVFVDEA